MGRIQPRNTKPEIALRRQLHRLGLRFRLDRADLPGRPDIVVPRYKTVIFVHGCFWHRHTGCKVASTPKTRVEFWSRKFEVNVERDRRVTDELKALGWRVLVAWECEVIAKSRLAARAARLAEQVRGACE